MGGALLACRQGSQTSVVLGRSSGCGESFRSFSCVRGTFVRAALESVAYQTNDLFTAINGDGIPVSVVRVDGGMTANDWLMQFLADIIDLPVDRPVVKETTALGAAMLALMQSDPSITLVDLASRWQRDASFTPTMDAEERNGLVAGWDRAMKRTLTEG